MNDTSCQSEQPIPSSRKSSRKTRNWQSDEDYLHDQDENSNWSHKSFWGEASSRKFIKFGHMLIGRGTLFHDDRVADFGGNDGTASMQFYLAHGIKPIVVDCEPNRIKYAAEVYGLKTYRTFVESMPELADKSIDWGFSSHTLEHCRDTGAALREMARVVKRGCYFVLPLERKSHAKRNHAHAICFTKLSQWRGMLRQNGWKPILSECPDKFEAHIYAEPK